MVFEYRVLRRIFGTKRDEVTGEVRRLHNEELYARYSSPNAIRAIKSRRKGGRACGIYGEGRRGAYTVLVGKPERKRLLRRPKSRWEDNIKMDLQKVGLGNGLN
jgi:hypothetical protein